MTRPEGFAAIPNWMIRDESFDIYDIAVYVALASHTGPGGVRPSQATLATEARCSERRVRTALEKLEDAGVVEVTQRRRKGVGAGRSSRLTNGYVLHPHGRLTLDEEPAPRAGRSELPAREDRPTGTSVQITPLIEEEPVEEEPGGVSFDDFWKVWPRKDGKANAVRAFNRAAKRAQPAVIIAAARAYAESPDRPPLQFVPHGATWLNGDRWEDPAPIPRENAPVAQTLTEKWGAGNEWMEHR